MSFLHPKSALAIHPSVEGFGWIVFDGPLSAYRWGVSWRARGVSGDAKKNEHCLRHAEVLLTEHRPAVLVLERATDRRHPRIHRLEKQLIALAAVHATPVKVFTRADVQAAFAERKATTRYAVATVVADYIPEIRNRLPKKRRAWDTEDSDMALFAAAALLIVHSYDRPPLG
jgi:hypothetical protein